MSTMTSRRSSPSLSTQALQFGIFAAAGHDLDVLCESAARTLVAGLGVDCCQVYKPSAVHDDLQFVAGHGIKEPWAQHACSEMALRSLTGSGFSVRPPAPGVHGGVSGMSVLIEGERSPFGALAVLSSTPRIFSAGDFEFAQSVAAVVTQMLIHAHHRRDCARLASVVSAASEVIIGITQSGRIFDWNDAAARLYGYSKPETIGRSLTEVFQSGLPSQFLTTLDVGCQSGTLGPFETVLQHRDGTQVASEVRLVPTVPSDGRIVSASMIVRDITEERRADETRRELTDKLKHAERLETIGRLAGGVVHDVNNMLTVISGCAGLMAPAIADNEPALKDLRQIELASQSAGQLTRDLLASGRQQAPRPAAADLSAVIHSVRGMLKPLIRKDIQVVSLAEEPIVVRANQVQLEQVLLNLSLNARDAMPAGGILLLLSRYERVSRRMAECYKDVPPGAYGVLEVTDTGIGMDRTTLARVFEPFFTTKGVGTGTGLGLTTAYGIIRQWGGYMTVDSEPGEGTIFRIYLPAADLPQASR